MANIIRSTHKQYGPYDRTVTVIVHVRHAAGDGKDYFLYQVSVKGYADKEDTLVDVAHSAVDDLLRNTPH